MRILIAVVLLTAMALAQEATLTLTPPLPACDIACLAASMDRLQVTLAEHNILLAEQNRLAELIANPPPLTKRQRTMVVVRTLGQFAVVATPIVIKLIQQQPPATLPGAVR
jgi:hypothetical protein